MSESLSLKVDARPELIKTTKQISFQDLDSSSTQSTGQSYTEVASSGDDNPSRQISLSAKSGSEETQRKGFATNPKSGSMTGFPNIHFAPAQANFSFHYADPNFGGLLAATYLPHAPIAFKVLAKALISVEKGEELDELKEEFENFISGLMSLPIKFPETQLHRSFQAKRKMVKQVERIIEEKIRRVTYSI